MGDPYLQPLPRCRRNTPCRTPTLDPKSAYYSGEISAQVGPVLSAEEQKPSERDRDGWGLVGVIREGIGQYGYLRPTTTQAATQSPIWITTVLDLILLKMHARPLLHHIYG